MDERDLISGSGVGAVSSNPRRSKLKRVVLVLSVALVAALPSAALAKSGNEGAGRLKAEIRGPGLDKPILLPGGRKQGAGLVRRVAETAGLSAALREILDPRFVPEPMLRTQPRGDLGPRYTSRTSCAGRTGRSIASLRTSIRTRSCGRPRPSHLDRQSPTRRRTSALSEPKRPAEAGTSRRPT